MARDFGEANQVKPKKDDLPTTSASIYGNESVYEGKPITKTEVIDVLDRTVHGIRYNGGPDLAHREYLELTDSDNFPNDIDGNKKMASSEKKDDGNAE
ncbi:unnamed protein product [Caenorhabditis bovis]|uniref:Uncharacterized protein n=1 Tax=Caenorhabditis bovis TaxID=2654633 RepID=A0A8S1FFG1_9PELO|nr:unnamed protein product [Caenorhabditis bovis]